MAGWEEVGDGVFCRRYEPWDVTVGAIRGHDGLLVVDTRANPTEAEELLADLRRLDPHPPVWVVNTHSHFDHTFGNGAFPDAEIWGHRSVPAALREGRHDAPDEPRFRALAVVPPQHPVSDHATLDLGDRRVELHHLGPAHTDGDLVVWVPDSAVLFAGDVVEESAPPAYGADSFPLDWPVALQGLADWPSPYGADLRVVPGHGAVVDRAFVARQQRDVAAVAQLLRELWAEGVPEEQALEAGGDSWPWPSPRLDQAVRRAYAQLNAIAGTGG